MQLRQYSYDQRHQFITERAAPGCRLEQYVPGAIVRAQMFPGDESAVGVPPIGLIIWSCAGDETSSSSFGILWSGDVDHWRDRNFSGQTGV